MSSNYYNRIEAEDAYEEMPKKCFSLLGLLSKIRNLCILILLAILVFTAWPSFHNESYMCFRLITGLIFNKEIFSLVVSSFIEGFYIQPIARSIELLALVVTVWKLIFRGKILAFLRIKSIVMLTLASYWIYLILFYALNITTLPIWNDYASFFIYSPMFCWLYPLGLDVAMKAFERHEKKFGKECFEEQSQSQSYRLRIQTYANLARKPHKDLFRSDGLPAQILSIVPYERQVNEWYWFGKKYVDSEECLE